MLQLQLEMGRGKQEGVMCMCMRWEDAITGREEREREARANLECKGQRDNREWRVRQCGEAARTWEAGIIRRAVRPSNRKIFFRD